MLLIAQAMFFSSLLSNCNNGDYHPYIYQRPEKTNDGIECGTLKEAYLDTEMIIKAVNRIHRGSFKEIHSMLIFKDDMLVLEEYFKGHEYQWDAPGHHGNLVAWNKDMLHHAHSVSKSITSICTGIAIDKGYIKNVNQSIFNYLPDYQHLKTEENKHITIEHLLTGTSGLQWAEWNAPLSSMENDQIAIWFHENGPVDFVLGRPMVAKPGTYFTYSGGNIELLGVIIENASGMAFEDFSEKFLFEPLGIDSAYWQLKYPSGEVHAAAGLKISPRDMVKIGAAMLNNGVWDGEQVLPVQWVVKSMYSFPGTEGIRIPGEDLGKVGYSYAWWTKKINHKGREINWFSANGWGGQKIVVLPELNSVIVFTGGTYSDKVVEYKIFKRFILPAFE